VYTFRPVFVQRDVNAVYAGGGGAMLFAGLCLLLAQTIGADNVYVAVFVGIPLSFLSVFSLTRRRLDQVSRGGL